MAKLSVYSVVSILLLGYVNYCRGTSSVTCLESDAPVCGTNGTHWFYFKNLCRLKNENTNRENNGLAKLDLTDISNCFHDCDQKCNEEYAPICATNDEDEQETFDNRCQFDLENCRYGNIWKVLHDGKCPTERQLNPKANHDQPPQQLPGQPISLIPHPINRRCPTHCTLEYDPVCATFEGLEQTFDNQCYMRADICGTKRAWVVKHNGECIERCNKNCPKIYSPMCATFNGQSKTFDNECFLDLEICVSGNPWDISYKGRCQNNRVPLTQPPLELPGFIQPQIDLSPFDPLTFILPSPLTQPLIDQPTPSNLSILACPLCSDSYKPVCGFSDGKQQTFNNECLLLSENCYSSNTKWTVGYQGVCHELDTQRNCPNFCPLDFDPVCATLNGVSRTFPNECELNYEVYKTNKQWVILNLGECDYCPVCSDEIEPVCAEFDGQTRTFDNICMIEAENCRTKKEWKIVSRTACEINNCPQVCPKTYIPICAMSNGEARTFGNICEMKREACNTNTVWTITSKGECPLPNDNCPKSCSLQYNPVCATYDGTSKEFINECFLRSEVCKTNKNWEFVNAGPCAPKVQHTTPYQGHVTEIITPITPIVKPEPKCQISKCLAFRDPVCATFNGEEKTFSNACFFNNYKCRTGEDWQIIKNGNCQKTSHTSPVPVINY